MEDKWAAWKDFDPAKPFKTDTVDYKPGRTPEELEDERRREALSMTHTERYRMMMRLMRRGMMLSRAGAQNVRKSAS